MTRQEAVAIHADKHCKFQAAMLALSIIRFNSGRQEPQFVPHRSSVFKRASR